MAPMSATPIKLPEGIKVNDTVRRTVVREGRVTAIGSNYIVLNGSAVVNFTGGEDGTRSTTTWELLDRPAPKPAHGSRWKTTINTRLIYDAHRDVYIVWEASRISACNVGDMVAASAITGLEADDDV